ncbi:MAG: acyltransferase [Ketobacter sp.]|nr:acyltransferase [Ketobacter sp.]
MNPATDTRPASILQNWSISRNFKSLFEQGGETFHLINGLRFFSFVWILVFHTVYIYGLLTGKELFYELSDTAPPWLWWIWNADKAVDLFFVISGFLISIILFKELGKTGHISLKRFYFRRYLRLTPIYAVIVLIYWLSEGRNYEWVWTNILYLNNFLPVDKMALHWTWTLAVEEQFYLVLPLILGAIYRKTTRPFISVLIWMLIASLLIRLGVIYYYQEIWNADYREMLSAEAVYPAFYTKLYDNLLTRYGPFVCGAIAAYGYCFKQDELRAWLSAAPIKSTLLNLLALATILFFTLFPVMSTEFSEAGPALRFYVVAHRTLFAGAVAWFMLSVFLNIDTFKPLARFLSLRCWQPLSQLTYSMYLVHFIVIYLCVQNVYQNLKLMGNLDDTMLAVYSISLSSVIALLITIIFGVLCWLLVEKPFLNMRDLFSINRGATNTAPLKHDL